MSNNTQKFENKYQVVFKYTWSKLSKKMYIKSLKFLRDFFFLIFHILKTLLDSTGMNKLYIFLFKNDVENY
jgi:hypothetical protein